MVREWPYVVEVVHRLRRLDPVHREPRVGAQHRVRGQRLVDRVHRLDRVGFQHRLGGERWVPDVRRQRGIGQGLGIAAATLAILALTTRGRRTG